MHGSVDQEFGKACLCSAMFGSSGRQMWKLGVAWWVSDLVFWRDFLQSGNWCCLSVGTWQEMGLLTRASLCELPCDLGFLMAWDAGVPHSKGGAFWLVRHLTWGLRATKVSVPANKVEAVSPLCPTADHTPSFIPSDGFRWVTKVRLNLKGGQRPPHLPRNRVREFGNVF